MSKQNIISKLANVEIAPENYTEGDKKYFTWNEAMEATEKVGNGWRLPTRSELVLIREEFGADDVGQVSVKKLCDRIGLSANGYLSPCDSSSELVGLCGCYWSSTLYNSERAYILRFNSSYAVTDTIFYMFGLSVRLVRDVATNEDDNYLEKGA